MLTAMQHTCVSRKELFPALSWSRTIYSVEGEWEYFFAHFRKGVKSLKKGLRMKFGYLEGQSIDFMEDSEGWSWFWRNGGWSTIQKY